MVVQEECALVELAHPEGQLGEELGELDDGDRRGGGARQRHPAGEDEPDQDGQRSGDGGRRGQAGHQRARYRAPDQVPVAGHLLVEGLLLPVAELAAEVEGPDLLGHLPSDEQAAEVPAPAIGRRERHREEVELCAEDGGGHEQRDDGDQQYSHEQRLEQEQDDQQPRQRGERAAQLEQGLGDHEGPAARALRPHQAVVEVVGVEGFQLHGAGDVEHALVGQPAHLFGQQHPNVVLHRAGKRGEGEDAAQDGELRDHRTEACAGLAGGEEGRDEVADHQQREAEGGRAEQLEADEDDDQARVGLPDQPDGAGQQAQETARGARTFVGVPAEVLESGLALPVGGHASTKLPPRRLGSGVPARTGYVRRVSGPPPCSSPSGG